MLLLGSLNLQANKWAWVHLKDAAGNRRTYSLALSQPPLMTPVGVAITSTPGTLTVSTATNVSPNLTGQAITTSPGTLTVTIPGVMNKTAWVHLKDATGNRRTYSVDLYQPPSITLSGRSIALSQGTLIVGVTDSTSLTGQALTASPGTLSVQILESNVLTGQSIIVSQGSVTVTPIRNTSPALVGTQLVTSVGSLTTTTSDLPVLTGIAITVGQGTLVADVGGSVEVTPTGVAITSSAGILVGSGQRNVLPTITGIQITSARGTYLVVVNQIKSILGQQITSATTSPTVLISLSPNVSLTGQSITSSAGTLSFSSSTFLTGQGITSATTAPIVTSNYQGYTVTTATALTTVDSVYQSLGFAPSDGDRSYWPLTVSATTLTPETNGGNATGRIASGPVTGNFTLIYYRLSGGLYYTVDVTLVAGAASNIFLTGQQINLGTNNLFVQNSYSISGQAITSSVGSLTTNTHEDVTPAGQSITISPGALGVSLSPNVSISGLGIVSSTTAPTVKLDSSLAGQAITTNLGTLTVVVNAQPILATQQIVSNTTTPQVSTGSTVTLTGLSLTSAAGVTGFSNVADITQGLTGQQIITSQGTPVVAINAIAQPQGITLQSFVGTLVTADRLVYLIGQQMTTGTKGILSVSTVETKYYITPHFVEYVAGNVLQ